VAKIIWLVGYPRSGLTWLQFLIGNLVLKPPADSAEMLLAIPDLHRSISAAHLYGEKTIFARMHLQHSDTLPLREDTIGAIYLVRNPFEVIASNAHLALLEADDEVLRSDTGRRDTVARVVDEFARHGGTLREIERGIGTWTENVESWTTGGDRRRPRLVLRYESLLDQPEQALTQLAQFLHQAKAAPDIAGAIDRSQLGRLRAMEEQEVAAQQTGIFYQRRYDAAYPHGLRFLSRGETLPVEGLLSPAQRDALRQRFGRVMERFGYN
jgi:hypothetical protein